MSLRHALPGVLDAGPMTGCSLAEHVGHSAANGWHAPHSQIYPQLRKMLLSPGLGKPVGARGRPVTAVLVRAPSSPSASCTQVKAVNVVLS